MTFTITIDNQPVEVSPDMTVLEAAQQAGHSIPTLCFFMSDRLGQKTQDQTNTTQEHTSSVVPDTNHSESNHSESANFRIVPASCQVCLVKINGRITPSCTAQVTQGMVVECDTPELVALRRTAFELLLSDHVGDCEAPCRLACPTRLDIPRMLREIADNRLDLAIQTIWQAMPIPAILGRICSRPCERVCRRDKLDEAVSICQLKRYVADTVLGKVDVDTVLNVKPCTNKHIAVLGAGISGLCTAFHLAVQGCHVTLFEQKDVCGGRLNAIDGGVLPPEVLELEINHLLSVGNDHRIELRLNESVPWYDTSFMNAALNEYAAVVLATGMNENKTEAETSGQVPIAPVNQCFKFDSKSGVSNIPGLFAVGTALRGKTPYVRSAADGRDVAHSVLTWLATGKAQPLSAPFSVHVKQPQGDELEALGRYALAAARVEPADAGTDDYSTEEVQRQAGRCLHCDCRGRDKCRLLQEASKLDLAPSRFTSDFRQHIRIERGGNVFFEPGKCIKCGLCIRIAEKFGEPYGLTFIGRGFDVQMNVPFDRSLEEGLQKTGRLCAEACPTGALTLAGKSCTANTVPASTPALPASTNQEYPHPATKKINSNRNNMQALVTGGGGFLGTYIVERLLARGAHVRIFCRGDYPDLAARGVEIIRGDLRQWPDVANACRGMDIVFHTASLPGISVNRRPFYDTNVLGTKHVLDACRENNVERLVYTSSPSVTDSGLPQNGVNESTPYPKHYLSFYPETKAIAERMVLQANKSPTADGSKQLLTCAIRPRLIWGPHDHHLIPRLIKRAQAGQLTRVGDGTNLLDMVYVENAADAHLLAADALTPTGPVAGNAYYISQGQPVNCWDWINRILELVGLEQVHRSVSFKAAWRIGWCYECLYRFLRLKDEPPMTRFLATQLAQSYWFDISRAQRDFGYTPRISTEEGLARLADDLKSRNISGKK